MDKQGVPLVQHQIGAPPDRIAVNRRTLTRAAVWAVPAVSVAAAAPAFAASACSDPAQRRSTSASGFTRTSNTQANGTWTDPDGATATYVGPTVSITSVLPAGLAYGPTSGTNFQFTLQTLGTLTSLALHQRPTNTTFSGANRATHVSRTTFSFSQTMFNLSFTLTDIDSATNDFWDFAYLESSDGFTVTSRGANVVGSATSTAPLRASGANLPADNATSTNGNASVTFAQTKSFTLVYGSYQNGDITQDTVGGGDQVIGLSNFTASIGPAGCP